MSEIFIVCETKDLFLQELGAGGIPEDAIVFIGETLEIYTHGVYYDGSKIDLNNIEESLKNFVIENLNKRVQTIYLREGFTWVSFYVKTSLAEVQKALGDKGVSIGTSTDGTGYPNLLSIYNTSLRIWEGNFPELDFSLMYQIEVTEPLTINLLGEPLNPKDILITLNPRCSYISFPLTEELSVSQALYGLTATNGDIIKSHDGSFSTFVEGQGWTEGSLSVLEPGRGYMYFSYAEETKTFVYPTELDLKFEESKKYTDFKISTFDSKKVTQKIHLTAGWNWISFYVDITLQDLQDALGSCGVSIKHDLSDVFTNNVEGVWTGNLETLDLTTSYLVQTSEDCDIYLSGNQLNPSNLLIRLNPGSTYIPYPLSQELDINIALQNLKASAGDMIKGYGQNYIATYYPTVGWVTAGETFNFVPGQGYLYTSNNQEPVSFTYPNYFYAPFGNVEVVSRLGHSTEKAASQDLVTKELSKKQDTLKSGETIKTVNGQSLLGSGDIKVATINYDLNVKAINHRGFSYGAPENTIPAYILSKKKGFTYVEGDVSFTKDGVAVLLHDATIDRTSNGSGNINNLTYQEVLQYDFGSWFSKDFEGVKIPTFTEWITLCKNLGLHPYIELKSSGNYTQTQITQIVNEVTRCGMKGKVTYISFKDTYLGYVKTADASARLGYLCNPKGGITSTQINACKALKTTTNEVFMDVRHMEGYLDVTEAKVDLCIAAGLPLEVWTINSEEIIKTMPKYISGVTSDSLIAGKVLYESSLIYEAPESTWVPTNAVTLDKSSLNFTDKESATLVATLDPSNASDPIVWKSSDSNIATVNNGVVTPISDGNCNITASSDGKTASCSIMVKFAKYSISSNLIGCSLSNTNSVITIGDTYTTNIVPDAEFSLKDADMLITMGGVDITATAYSNGIISITNVTGDIFIDIACVVVPVYSITRSLVGCTSDSAVTAIGAGNPYTETFTAESGYSLNKADIQITMGGVDITHYYSDGVLSVPEVTGDILISVAAYKLAVYTITRNLIGCTSDSSLTEIRENSSYTETFTPEASYAIDRGQSYITMGEVDIKSFLVGNTLTIPQVTGDIVIRIECTELSTVLPVVALDLLNVGSDGVIKNLGIGGSTYDATIKKVSSSDSFIAQDAGLTLTNHAYANIPYGFNASTPFTIIIQAKIGTKSSKTYQRIFRTDSDAPSLFYSKNSTALGAKLSGVSGGWTIYDNLAQHDKVQTLNTCYLSFENQAGFDESIVKTYIYISDGTTIKWYVNGVLMASQSASNLTASTYIGLGDNNESTSYYASKITISRFEIYDSALVFDPGDSLPTSIILTGSDFIHGPIYQYGYYEGISTPYLGNTKTRCRSAVDLHLTLKPGIKVKLEGTDVNGDALDVAIQTFGEDAVPTFNATGNMAPYLNDSTWKTPSDVYQMPIDDKYVWVVVKRTDNANIQPSEIAEVKITEIQ